MKKRFRWLGLLSGSLLCLSCSQTELEDTRSQPISEKALADSAMASSAPAVEDTVLQQVVEVTLKALGNTLEEIKYDKDTLEVKANSLVKLTFINEGIDMPMVHNVVFTTPGAYKEVALAGSHIGAPGNYVPNDSTVLAASPMALPGQTVEMNFKAPDRPAAYHYVCTYPDHWRKMHGVLLVK